MSVSQYPSAFISGPSFQQPNHDDGYWFDFDCVENPPVHSFNYHDDWRSQSTDVDSLHALLPVARENERFWHEQKHLSPSQPSPEHSMMIDVDHSDPSWSADDGMHLDSCVSSPKDWGDSEEPGRPVANTEPSVVSCAECATRFDKYQDLEKHGKQSNHLPFACQEPLCNKRLARRDTMQRHTAMHREPQFSCEWCRANGVSRPFTRKDHCNTHMSKCSYRPEDQLSVHDAAMKRRKIKEFMGPMLHRNELHTLQHRLNTMDPLEMQDLYEQLARTVLGGTSAEMRKIRH